MRDARLYSKAEIFQVNEVRTSNVNRVILMPYGFLKNGKLANTSKGGDIMHFKDGKMFRIISRCLLNPASPQTETICQMIYGQSIRDIFKTFKEKYKADIYDESLLLITYDPNPIEE